MRRGGASAPPTFLSFRKKVKNMSNAELRETFDLLGTPIAKRDDVDDN